MYVWYSHIILGIRSTNKIEALTKESRYGSVEHGNKHMLQACFYSIVNGSQ